MLKDAPPYFIWQRNLLFFSLFVIYFYLRTFSLTIVFSEILKKTTDTSYLLSCLAALCIVQFSGILFYRLYNFSNLYTKVFKAIPISPQRKDIRLSFLSWNGLIWNLKRIAWNFYSNSGIEIQVINKFPQNLFNPLPL